MNKKLYDLLDKYDNGILTDIEIIQQLTSQELKQFIELLNNRKGGYIPQ